MSEYYIFVERGELSIFLSLNLNLACCFPSSFHTLHVINSTSYLIKEQSYQIHNYGQDSHSHCYHVTLLLSQTSPLGVK